MEERYIIDTNIIIYYLDNKIPKSEIEKLNLIFKNSFNISTISVIELLGWNKLNSFDKNKIHQFLSNANIYYVDHQVQEKSIEIKQEKKTATPDAIIAATSVLNNFTIVTRNVSDFNIIKQIRIYNPFDNQ